MKKLLIFLTIFTLLLSITSAQELFVDNFKIKDTQQTNKGGLIFSQDYKQVNGKGGIGNAIQLKNDNYVTYDKPFSKNIKEGYLMLWFKPFEERSGLVDIKTDTQNYGIFLNSNKVWIEDFGGVHQAHSNNEIKLGKWNQLIAYWTVDDSHKGHFVVYLNGEKANPSYEFSNLYPPGENPIIKVGTHWYYKGSDKLTLGKLKIYEGELTPKEAQKLYENFKKN